MKASHRAWARFSAVGVLVVASAGAFAQAASEPGRGKEAAAELKKRFAAADVNHDGRLTREEAKAGMPGVYDNFDQIDTAKTGSVSMAEIAAFLRAGPRRARPGAEGAAGSFRQAGPGGTRRAASPCCDGISTFNQEILFDESCFS